MSKSNHKKHGFDPIQKQFRRSKDFVSVKTYMSRILKDAKWNGKSPDSLFRGEVGRLENIRFIETGQ